MLNVTAILALVVGLSTFPTNDGVVHDRGRLRVGIMIRLRPPHDNMHALLLRSSAAALMLLASHTTLAATPAPFEIVLYEGQDYPVCRAITAALRRLGPPVSPTTWVAHPPPVRGATSPAWTSVADAAAVANDALPIPGVSYGPAEETIIPGVVIETPPATGTRKSVTADLHLVRRAMQDDGTGRFSDVKGHLGQVLGWNFEAVNLKLFPSVTHVPVGIHSVPSTMVLWGGQPWFGTGLGTLGTLEARPVLGPTPRSHPDLLIRQRCLLGSAQATTSQ